MLRSLRQPNQSIQPKHAQIPRKKNPICQTDPFLDVSNRRSRFAAIRIAIGPQRFRISRFELQGRKPLESLLRLYYFLHFRKRQFVHKHFVHNFCAQTLPPPNHQNEGFSLEFLLEGPQTELRTLSQNCEQTLRNFANKQNYEQTGVSDTFKVGF